MAEYQHAMVTKVRELIQQRTWKRIPRDNAPLDKDENKRKGLKGAWMVKLKSLPDGSPSESKARYCVRGDMQREEVDYFDIYTLVVQ